MNIHLYAWPKNRSWAHFKSTRNTFLERLTNFPCVFFVLACKQSFLRHASLPPLYFSLSLPIVLSKLPKFNWIHKMSQPNEWRKQKKAPNNKKIHQLYIKTSKWYFQSVQSNKKNMLCIFDRVISALLCSNSCNSVFAHFACFVILNMYVMMVDCWLLLVPLQEPCVTCLKWQIRLINRASRSFGLGKEAQGVNSRCETLEVWL